MFTTALLGFALAASGDRFATLDTSAGKVVFYAAGHGSVRVTTAEHTIWIDPWSKASLSGEPADIILITDIHPDHLDADAVQKVGGANATIIGPVAVAEALTTPKVDHILRNGQKKVVDGIGIEAVPMYNIARGPEKGQLYHEKGRGNGYILTIGDKRVYFAGDTECTAEMRGLKDIDLAFVPMNLPYTMPPDEAAMCVKTFAPGRVIPYHYRDSNLGAFYQGMLDSGVEVELLDFY